MSGHTRRLTQSPTRTTPGSYEAPVEGIVDYGAFSRGFEKGIAPGLAYLAENAKEEEMPDLITLEDFDYTGTASKSGALGVSTEASNSMNLGIDNKIRDIQARLDSAVVRKDVNLQRDIMNEYNTLKKVVAGAQTAFNGIAGAEGAIDARQAIDKKIGRNADGKGLSWYEISTIGNQKDSAFEFVTNANGTGGLRVNGYYFDTTSINENTVSKITPLTGGLNAAIKDYSSRVKAPEVEKNQVQYDQNGRRIISQRISQNSYDNMEEAADKFSQTVLDNKATFQANYLDSLYGVNKSISENPSEFFKGIAIEDNVGDGKKYKTEQDYIAAIEKGEDTYTFKGTSFADFASGSGSEQSVQGLIRKYGSNHYKLTQGSKAYAANDYGIAVEKDNLFKSAPIQLDDDQGGGSGSDKQTGNVKGRLFNIASNLNSSVYNFATPGKSNYLKEDGARTIDLKGLGQGFIADTDGTKAEIKNGRVIREGNRMFLELTYEAGKETNDEKFPLGTIVAGKKGPEFKTDFDGRKVLTERIYKGQFGASTADQAKDLLSGEQNIYKDRTKVQNYFFMSGKDETMFRRLDIIRKFEENPDDPTVFDNLTEDDIKQLGRARSEGTIGYKFQQAYIKSKNPLLN